MQKTVMDRNRKLTKNIFHHTKYLATPPENWLATPHGVRDPQVENPCSK